MNYESLRQPLEVSLTQQTETQQRKGIREAFLCALISLHGEPSSSVSNGGVGGEQHQHQHVQEDGTDRAFFLDDSSSVRPWVAGALNKKPAVPVKYETIY